MMQAMRVFVFRSARQFVVSPNQLGGQTLAPDYSWHRRHGLVDGICRLCTTDPAHWHHRCTFRAGWANGCDWDGANDCLVCLKEHVTTLGLYLHRGVDFAGGIVLINPYHHLPHRLNNLPVRFLTRSASLSRSLVASTFRHSSRCCYCKWC